MITVTVRQTALLIVILVDSIERFKHCKCLLLHVSRLLWHFDINLTLITNTTIRSAVALQL